MSRPFCCCCPSALSASPSLASRAAFSSARAPRPPPATSILLAASSSSSPARLLTLNRAAAGKLTCFDESVSKSTSSKKSCFPWIGLFMILETQKCLSLSASQPWKNIFVSNVFARMFQIKKSRQFCRLGRRTSWRECQPSRYHILEKDVFKKIFLSDWLEDNHLGGSIPKPSSTDTNYELTAFYYFPSFYFHVPRPSRTKMSTSPRPRGGCGPRGSGGTPPRPPSLSTTTGFYLPKKNSPNNLGKYCSKCFVFFCLWTPPCTFPPPRPAAASLPGRGTWPPCTLRIKYTRNIDFPHLSCKLYIYIFTFEGFLPVLVGVTGCALLNGRRRGENAAVDLGSKNQIIKIVFKSGKV